ncbi:hypothetical protein M9Y10_032428 [Tritrichomonas musculus]|uniref:Uncharacterized protein n=1 Tax=Tritrichomonas musculus TaxID=1915356 RepID=A0ABR2GZ85_9EUKA
MYKIQFTVCKRWVKKPLTPEISNKLLNNFTVENFVFDIDSNTPEYFYEKGGEELPVWSLFAVLKFWLYEKYEGNNDRGGSFFQYQQRNSGKKSS